MPIIHIAKSRRLAFDGVFLLTDNAKSFIQFIGLDKLSVVVQPTVCTVLKADRTSNPSSQENIPENPIDRSGKNGTAKRTNSRIHRLYCIRLDRIFLHRRFANIITPMIALIKILQIREWTKQSVTLFSSFFRLLRKQCAQGINLCFRESIVFQIGRQHGGNITIIKTF